MANGGTEALDAPDMGTAALPGRGVLEIGIVRTLSVRSNARGAARAAAHLAVMAGTGFLVWAAMPSWWTLIPALFLHGFTLVTMFAPMHECVHRTAFASPLWNGVFGWFAGLLSFYNFHFYRYYHTWHHRYTQDPERDPELQDPKPATIGGYLAEISGLWFWPLRPWRFLKMSLGLLRGAPFVPESARGKVALSAGLQLAVYISGVASIAMGYPFAWWYWFFPALLAQPCLRAITLVEHTGCSIDSNGLTNTRTTLTSFPVRLLMWNMPFHTEHHLYPSIPFHHLPEAHRFLKASLAHLSPSYPAANREVLRFLAEGRTSQVAHEQ